jgi:3'-phosphoadenosine 5'-phosphosulfate sulfotransferase
VSIKVVVNLKVGEVFANREHARAAAGLEIKVHRDIDDPTGVVGIGTAPSKESFFEFMTSPEQQEAMKAATVQGPPDITFLEG